MAKEAGIFTILLRIITELGLIDALKEAEAVTVFAPPDEAFQKLPEGTIESLTPEQAKEIVLRHVVDSKVLAADVPVKLKTLGGEVIKLINRKGQILIEYEGNVITVDKADVMARNGVIHIINTVIIPEAEEDLSKELKDSKEQRLGTTLQPKCIGPKCLGADVVEVAKGAGIFTTLLKIVTDVGLVDALKEAEAVTVFAPPDEAFAKLPAGIIESLTPEQAWEIVLRHVVNSKLLAADIPPRLIKIVKTLGGENIKLANIRGQVLIDYEGTIIRVDKADVMAKNGVIHIIDKVIIPSDKSTTDTAG